LRGLSFDSPADQIEAAEKNVRLLHTAITNWLRLEAFTQHGYRAQYIVSYLGQVEAILSYASHKRRALTNTLAGADFTPSDH
jgi:hypothetical protein